MKNRIIILIIILTCISLGSVKAELKEELKSNIQETEIDSLSLDEAVSLIIQYNPELKAVEKDIAMASARIIQAKLLPNPSIFMETEDGASKSFGFGKTYKSVFGLSQPILLGGKINARVAVAEKERDIADLNYEMKLRQIIAEAKKSFVSILAAQQLVDIAEGNLDIARRVFESVKMRVEAQAAPETELAKAQIQLFQEEINLKNAQTELFQAQKRLHGLWGNIDIKVKNYRGELKQTLPELTSKEIEEEIITSYPVLVNAKKAQELAERQHHLVQAERYPDIDIGVGAGKERGDSGDNNIIEWSVNLPLPLFDRNQGSIQEAKMLVAKTEKEYENTLNKVRLEIKQTLSSLENVINQVRTYKERVLPQAEKSLSLISEGYHAGKFPYIELLDAQRTLTETRENYIRVLENLNNIVIDIERLTGKSIEGKKE